MSIDFLKQHAQTLSEFAEDTAARAAQNPQDPWLAIAADNQQQAASDALQHLSIAYAEEAGELVDLRLMGPRANGSISLDAFIKIADPLSKAWKAAAYRIRHGISEGRAGKEIADVLNLKLAGIASGSTRVLITGSSTPDLSGESLLQSTLQQTFRLLTAKNEEFYDAVDAVGGKAAHYLGDAIKEIEAAGMSAEFTWHALHEQYSWYGNSTEIERIKSLIAAATKPESYEEEITGDVSGITDTGKLELRTATGKVLIRFPLDLMEKVQHLSIAKHASLRVSTTKYWDVVGRKDVFQRLLIDILS
ncbi:hypothetical protein GTP58_11620 [Duganella sp. CY15W]|uniref:hypothetical protein n=1 Tax=Duganella sp. CY15W TaxID=2692172 RepID=UPI00136CAF8E|nr:hypothetical protein [Duganella sp. CY15W]MYM28968.1 hypothetical protein [Duganella sp. CY15W]